jgi:hypothetical protein
MKGTLKFIVLSLNYTCSCHYSEEVDETLSHIQHDGIHCDVSREVMRMNSRDVTHLGL